MHELTNEAILKIAGQYKTPCFIYDLDSIQDSYKKLREALPTALDIYYSVKANPAVALISEIYKMGAGLELCSFFEIEAAVITGARPEHIIFVGPGKSEREIEKCLVLGIYCIVCESESELNLISKIASQRNQIARVVLRINPLHTSKTAMLKMAGQALQFGLDEELIFEKMGDFLKKPSINIIGIHVYHGTRILDSETIVDNTRYIFTLAEKLQIRFGLRFQVVDIGGGLGVPYFSGEKAINFKDFKISMNREIALYLKKFPRTKIILETGRFLVASSGIFIARIRDVKVSRGKSIIVTDGGMNCFMAASSFGSILNRNFKISLVSSFPRKESKAEYYMITGPLCTPGDVMGRQVFLPKAYIGDYILIHNAGAYGPSASPVMFLSHGFPAEILFKQGRAERIRSCFSAINFFQNQTHREEHAS